MFFHARSRQTQKQKPGFVIEVEELNVHPFHVYSPTSMTIPERPITTMPLAHLRSCLTCLQKQQRCVCCHQDSSRVASARQNLHLASVWAPRIAIGGISSYVLYKSSMLFSSTLLSINLTDAFYGNQIPGVNTFECRDGICG